MYTSTGAQEIMLTATGQIHPNMAVCVQGQKDPQQLPRALLSSGAMRTKSGGVSPPGASAAPKCAHWGRNQTVPTSSVSLTRTQRSAIHSDYNSRRAARRWVPVRQWKDLSLFRLFLELLYLIFIRISACIPLRGPLPGSGVACALCSKQVTP